MANTQIEVDGLDTLARTMARAARAMEDMPASNANAAAVIARRASSAAPRKSGALAGSIRPDTAKATAIVYAGSASVPYAGVINYGWAGHNISPNPFLTSALSSTEPEWLDDYAREVQKQCDTVRGA